jgi:hypothetical protein
MNTTVLVKTILKCSSPKEVVKPVNYEHNLFIKLTQQLQLSRILKALRNEVYCTCKIYFKCSSPKEEEKPVNYERNLFIKLTQHLQMIKILQVLRNEVD